jgi:hypothetical protein
MKIRNVWLNRKIRDVTKLYINLPDWDKVTVITIPETSVQETVVESRRLDETGNVLVWNEELDFIEAEDMSIWYVSQIPAISGMLNGPNDEPVIFYLYPFLHADSFIIHIREESHTPVIEESFNAGHLIVSWPGLTVSRLTRAPEALREFLTETYVPT